MAALTLSENSISSTPLPGNGPRKLSTPEVVTDSTRFQETRQAALRSRNDRQQASRVQANRKRPRRHSPDGVESDDAEMRHMAQEEEKLLTVRKEQTERELKLLLLPTILSTTKTLSLKSAPALARRSRHLRRRPLPHVFALRRIQGWKVEVMESSPAQMGGVKEIVAAIQGKKVYSK